MNVLVQALYKHSSRRWCTATVSWDPGSIPALLQLYRLQEVWFLPTFQKQAEDYLHQSINITGCLCDQLKRRWSGLPSGANLLLIIPDYLNHNHQQNNVCFRTVTVKLPIGFKVQITAHSKKVKITFSVVRFKSYS